MIAAMIASIAFLTISATPSYADSHMSNMKMNTMKAVHVCPKGKHWVNGYVKKDGHKVAGYCRKG
jgi:transcription-repair coupling factor (superfamily II helicase)